MQAVIIHNCILRCILSRRKSSHLSIPEKQWHSAPSGPRVHYFSGMDRYSDFLLYLNTGQLTEDRSESQSLSENDYNKIRFIKPAVVSDPKYSVLSHEISSNGVENDVTYSHLADSVAKASTTRNHSHFEIKTEQFWHYEYKDSYKNALRPWRKKFCTTIKILNGLDSTQNSNLCLD